MGTAEVSAANDPFIGRQVAGTYQIVRRIGSGGMGSVYEARHVRLDSAFAIKMLHMQLSPNEEILARFHREARSASQLKHPNILDVFDVNKTEDNVHYIVEEFLEGSPLSDVVDREGTLSVSRTAHIIGQVCDAMSAAHDRGIVHRDLKPENIFLIQKGDDCDFVKVLDFGIAKMQQEGSTQLTQASQVMGTPDYISPEQAADSKAVDHRSDVYSTGVILYRIFTGRLPYEVANPILALETVRKESPVPPKQRRADLPDEIAAVIERAMARRPDDRYQTMGELAAAVHALVGAVDVKVAAPTIPQTMHQPIAGGSSVEPTPVPVTGPQPPAAGQHPTPLPATKITEQGQRRADATGSPIPPTAEQAAVAKPTPSSPELFRKIGGGPGGGPTPMAGAVGEATQSVVGKKPVWVFLGAGVVVVGAVVVVAMTVGKGGGGGGSDAGGSAGDPRRVDSPGVDAPASPADAAVARKPGTGPAPDGRTATDAGPPLVAGMTYVAGGSFKMGRADGSPLERPVHPCRVGPFYLDQREVSEGDFAAFLGGAAGEAVAGGAPWKGFKPKGDGKLPLVSVTWKEARSYCQDQGKRLPTEAEWELAARGEDLTSLYPSGAEPPGPEAANFCRQGKKCSKEQAILKPAARTPIAGLWDMIGNAGEWVDDRFGGYTTVCGRRTTPPRAFRFGRAWRKFRVIRGASFGDFHKERLTATYRFFNFASQRLPMVGFRCAKDGPE